MFWNDEVVWIVRVPADGVLPNGSPGEYPMPPPLLTPDEFPQLVAVWLGQAATLTAPPKTVLVMVTVPP